MPETDLQTTETHALWVLDLAFGIIAGVAFTTIAYILVRHMTRLGGRRLPPLAAATAFILFIKGFGHLLHAFVLVRPLPGTGTMSAEALRSMARLQASQPAIWIVDGLAAAAAVTYLLLRLRSRTTPLGSSLYDDLGRRQSQAMNLHDNVVQHIVRARWAMEIDKDEGAAAMVTACRAVEHIIEDLEAKLSEEEVVAPV